MPRKPLIPASPDEADYAGSYAADPQPAASPEDPMERFRDWLAEAVKAEPNDPNALTLATVDADGLPDARMVLLKDVGPEGFTFYTNLDSAKGRQLAAHPRAALVFHWKSLRRQVRARGLIEPVSEAEADAYFATRARSARIGAWASAQSRPMDGPLALEKAVAAETLRFGLGEVPRPPHWSGFRLVPLTIEFWRDRPFRLHERRLFTRDHAASPWTTSQLFP